MHGHILPSLFMMYFFLFFSFFFPVIGVSPMRIVAHRRTINLIDRNNYVKEGYSVDKWTRTLKIQVNPIKKNEKVYCFVSDIIHWFTTHFSILISSVLLLVSFSIILLYKFNIERSLAL